MERSVWSDERIDDLVARNDTQFELLLSEIRDTRTEVRELRRDMQAEFASVRRDMFHGAIALFAALVAMYATMLVHMLT
jgi:hypothetical protein